MSESLLVSSTLRALNLQGGVHAMRNALGGRTFKFGLGPGSADIIACIDGRFVALEGKLPGEKQHADQVLWEATIKRVGGVYGVFRSVQEAMAIVDVARSNETSW